MGFVQTPLKYPARVDSSVPGPGKGSTLGSISRSRPGWVPALVRIVCCNSPCDRLGSGSEILFEHDPGLVDDKGHDAGIAIFCWKGDHRKTAGHMAIDDVVLGPAGCARALLRQYFEVITVIRRRRPRGIWAIAFGPGAGDQRTQRALIRGSRRLPIEPVTVARGTAELLRVFALSLA